MKFTLSVSITLILAYVVGMFFPWWTIAIPAFLVALFIHQKPIWSFLAGFAAIFILWGVSSFMISQANNHLLAEKISELVLKSSSSILIIILTGIIGGLVGGLSALSASYLTNTKK